MVRTFLSAGKKTDNTQIRNITFYYNRFSISNNGSLKSIILMRTTWRKLKLIIIYIYYKKWKQKIFRSQMSKKDNIKTFIDEIYNKPPMRKYPTNKIVYIHIHETWSIDLADMINYKTSNSKRYRYIHNIGQFLNLFVGSTT